MNDVGAHRAVIELCGNDIAVSTAVEDHLLTMTLQFGQPFCSAQRRCSSCRARSASRPGILGSCARGQGAEASKKYYELQPLRDVWKSIYRRVWNKKGATHPLPQIKYWMELIGMAGGPVRPPEPPMSKEQKADLKARIQSTGWMEKLYPKTPAVR